MKPKAGSESLILRIMPFSTAIHSTSFVNDKIRHELMRDRGSSVSIVSGYGLDDRAIEVRFPDKDKRIFPLVSVCRPALGPTQPPVQWVPGGPFPGAKAQPRRDADRSPPSSAEAENEWKLYLVST
jgi:hypothetical protein